MTDSILPAVLDAIRQAMDDEQPLFAAAFLSRRSDPRLDQVLQGSGPVGLILQGRLESRPGPLHTRCQLLHCQLLIAVRRDATDLGVDAAMSRLLQVRSAAIRAIESADLPGAGPWQAGGRYVPALQWTEAEEDPTPGEPWLACRTTLQIASRIDPPSS
ncbi:MAG: hypothetical protein ACLFUJ_02985 [Phycisphaerae bacterium]